MDEAATVLAADCTRSMDSGANTRVDRVTAVAEPRPVPLPPLLPLLALRTGLLLPLPLPLLLPPLILVLSAVPPLVPPLPLDSRICATGIVADIGIAAAANTGVDGEGARVMAGDRLAPLPALSFSFTFA